MTRVPLASDSPTFSASWAQQVTSKKETCSSHSWVWRFCQRRLTARPKVATAWPRGREAQLGVAGDVADDGDGVVCHGDLVLLPGRGGRLRPASPSEAAAGGLVVGQADELVADDLVREAQDALEGVEVGAVGHDLEDHVEALVLVVDLVGEAAPAPPSVVATVPPRVATWAVTDLTWSSIAWSSRSRSKMTISS